MKRAAVLLALVLVACSQGPDAPPGAEATATPEPTPVPTVAAEPLVIEGAKDSITKRFEILAGDYIVVATGEATDPGVGNVIIVIYNEAGDSRTLVNDVVDGAGSWSYEAIEYGYPDGQYHLDVTAPAGKWSVTFNPEPNP